MGIGSKKFPPLPAPTETDIITPTELTTADDIDHEDDGPADEASHFSLPDDGTPITIKTRGHKLNRSQTSLLIEYFEGGKTSPSASGVERKPSVRVRLTPSKKNRNNHIQITETKSSRKTSLTRRVPLPSTADSHIATETLDAEDLDSMQSYASATEESNVSRNPIDIEIDRSERRRRPASPLIPAADAKQSSYMTTNMSDISAIPTDSFLDGSGPTNLTYREVEKRQSRSPSSSRISAAGGAGALAGSALADKSRNSKSRSETRDRIVLPKSTDKVRDKDRKQRSSKSRASSLSEKQVEDQQSVRSGASKSSINNPKLLETVEDAIRRLILPELSALKREQSKHEDLPDAEPTLELEIEETERLATIMLIALMGWMERAIAGTAAAGLAAAAALSPKSPVSDDRRQRRRRRADGSARSRSLGRDKYAEEYEEEEAPAPPMPLMSEINPSELTRTSILSAETEHPRSELEEYSSVQAVTRGDISATSSPSRSAATLQQTLGTRHANVSSGDLNAIPRQRIDDYHEDYQSERNMPPTHFRDDYNDEEFETSRAGPRQLDYEQHDDGADYYNTQDVPPPLKYVPYQPERRGLSPIYSVSGYTEGGSEAPGQRDSRLTNGSLSPDKSPRHSNVLSRGFDDQSVDDRSIRSSGQDYRSTMYTDDGDYDRADSSQAVHDVGAKPYIQHAPTQYAPAGVESNVASLVDGSMLDQSVLTAGSALSENNEYGKRDSTISYDAQSASLGAARGYSPDKLSVKSQRDLIEEREGIRTPTSSRHGHSQDFAGEYDLDEYGHKVAPTRYRNSASTSRHSPTASEKAIALGAVGAAAAALKAAKDRSKQPTVEEVQEDFVPEGVSRNKSFKERTMDGRELATTPAHSIDRLDYDDEPKMGASAMPGLHDPMPEAEYVDDDLITNPSLVREELNHTPRAEQQWAPVTTPRQSDVAAYDQYDDETRGDGPSLGLATAAGAAAIATAAAMARNRQASQEPDDEWQRTSTDRKRDTLITNPYDGASPVVNPDLLNARGLDPDGFGAGYHTGSPAGQKHFDEGYISQGPIHSPSIQPKGKAMMSFSDAGAEDPFYTPAKGHSRHLSGMSQGMGSPIYDAATGAGIERIESKDIIALMQHLMVRDAQRSARDTEILVTLVRSAAEMRNSFEEIKKVLANTEDVIIQEVQENTENTVKNIIGGPRPFPGSAPRSVKGFSGASQDGTVDETTKKNNLFRRAFLKSFGAKDTNDLGRIEDMLNQLLAEVDTLKAQTARPLASSGQGQSFENIRPEVAYEQDRGYEPEGHAGTSTASHASQSGQLSLPQSRGPSTKLGYERKFSDHRISTVPEDTEEDYEQETDYRRNHQAMLSPPHQDVQRGGSVPLATPPHPGSNMMASLSNENTPITIKGKKHKSRGSSGWFPKISRWSESTATSVSKAFRGSGMSSKRGNDDEYSQRPPSRSGSDLGQYDDRRPFEEDRYDEEQLHSGFSQTNLPQSVSMPLDNRAPPPATYMTPEDPKYKAHRNSLNLQHPQPRQGQTERFQAALESQAHQYDTPMSPRSTDWHGSVTSLNRFPPQTSNRYSGGSAATGATGAAGAAGAASGESWGSSPTGPPRPPKEPMDDDGSRTPTRTDRVSRLSKNSPQPYNSVESGYGTGAGTHASGYSPKLENRNLNAALGVPTRRPSGPRAMTPKSAEEEEAREERRRKREEGEDKLTQPTPSSATISLACTNTLLPIWSKLLASFDAHPIILYNYEARLRFCQASTEGQQRPTEKSS
ncbi:uncharacterized protein VDAG_00293 [Verticillium dahliae VdLs.17]|uniref:Uncharacterized protein n=1 Tax=Verticillium dahliae (strain VdLs.17 / ATCC MYA-4575 / FGSC 10137) TaxID=498257 RepID=G2WRW0_VERDV|nr:uncharacterized protein VDAG_00293 [Verticillium dahliae VdLs.17]EGY13611.1 hypothetical protein VDAG_00293 [Verticillium dahliae VdLs.17]KAH6710064.1 hypothetical protein EV126DRAFT_475852 [Verticillium dahliae]